MPAPFIQTPRGFVTTTRLGKAELVWNTNFQPKWQKQYSDAQKFVDSEVLRLCEPFTPLLTGTMIKTGELGTDVGSGVVSWIALYSKYQYYGKVMAGNPRVPTTKNLVYHGGGLRGSFWFERMKEIHGDQIISGARKIAGRGA